jgi:glycosyltransferase involved in cell wall biosynthesis
MKRFRGQFTLDGLSLASEGTPGFWMRKSGKVTFLFNKASGELTIKGVRLSSKATEHSPLMQKTFDMRISLNGKELGRVKTNEKDPFEISVPIEVPNDTIDSKFELDLVLKGVAFTNFLALLGRLFKSLVFLPSSFRNWLQPFRRQPSNRAFLIQSISIDGQTLIDASSSHELFSSRFIVEHAKPGINVIGWFKGYLGVGESARACADSAASVGLEVDAVDMDLHLNGGTSDDLWLGGYKNPGSHAVTIAHVDAPQSFDLQRKHPSEMHQERYRIGYWAWELPEFPDTWIQFASAFDEIWCPSEFCREAMAKKLPVPVMSMPHAIRISQPKASMGQWRERFNLNKEQFLFLFSFDLNSYAPRKRPEAVIEAFRLAFGASSDSPVGLVMKMHGKGYGDLTRESILGLKDEFKNLYIVDQMLSRDAMTGLQWACDSFVSLHRSEGFGLGPAEMMALGKPVVSTNWSATSEFINTSNGCPVDYKLVELEENVGPYTKGQIWAEANVEHAAETMKSLVEDSEKYSRIGRAARAYMSEKHSPEAIGKLYLDRIKSIALF